MGVARKRKRVKRLLKKEHGVISEKPVPRRSIEYELSLHSSSLPPSPPPLPSLLSITYLKYSMVHILALRQRSEKKIILEAAGANRWNTLDRMRHREPRITYHERNKDETSCVRLVQFIAIHYTLHLGSSEPETTVRIYDRKQRQRRGEADTPTL